MNEFILCQNTLRQVAVEHSVHPSFMLGHIWGPEGWVPCKHNWVCALVRLSGGVGGQLHS